MSRPNTGDAAPNHYAVYNATAAVADAHTAGEQPRITLTLRTNHGSTDALTGHVEQSGIERMIDGKRYVVLLVHLDYLLEATAPGKTVYDADSITSNHVLLIVTDPADVAPGDYAQCAAYLTDWKVQVPVGMLGTLTRITRHDTDADATTAADEEGARR